MSPTYIRPHGATSQKAVIFIFMADRTSYLTVSFLRKYLNNFLRIALGDVLKYVFL
jgi:hypothetical protein